MATELIIRLLLLLTMFCLGPVVDLGHEVHEVLQPSLELVHALEQVHALCKK